MRMGAIALIGCFVGACGLARAAEPQLPKPGPEHEALKRFVGEWDTVMSAMGQESKGTAVYKMGPGQFWLTETFKGDVGGQPFEGRSTSGYDPYKKKYVGVWVDSMSPSMMVMEGTFDKDGKTYSETGEMMDENGKPMKVKTVMTFPDKDTMLFTMYGVADGKDQEMFKITYKRKK